MKRNLVRYTAKPELANENERLIRNVFRELHAKMPAGVRYTVLRLDDGTFVHFVSLEDGAAPITALDAFQEFQREIEERCVDEPLVCTAAIVGNYQMLAETSADG